MIPTVLVWRSELLPPSETFILAQARALRRYRPVIGGLRYIHSGLDLNSEERVILASGDTRRDKVRQRLYLEIGFAPDFQERIGKHRPTLIHAHFAVDAAAALPIQKRLGIPLVVTLHGYDVTSSDVALWRTAPGKVFLRRREELFERAQLFICVSEHIRAAAVARGFPEAKLRVLPIGVDLDLFKPAPERSRDPVVLFVGRLVEKKGCCYLLRAMRIVNQRHPTARLLIVGDGPLFNPLSDEARGTMTSCIFLGTQPQSVIRDLMQRASVLAAPSVVARTGDTEGLPIVLCEAQAAGLPIAGFEGPGVNEAVVHGETALLAPDGDDSALANCISAILDDADLAARMGEAGRKRVLERYSLARQTAQLEQVYDEALQ